MNRFKILLTLLVLALVQSAQASVNSITYKLMYNASTCMYDVYMTITSGSTAVATDQEAYTAQVTIVVPTGTAVGTASMVSNEPKLGSNSGGVVTRTTPKTWTLSNSDINNSSLPGYDVYSFVPNLTNAYYGTLNTNDNILLFSLPISTSTCGAGIRLWNNNEIQGSSVGGGDPSSANFGGQDYNNGHDFSSPSNVYQAYVGNGTSNATPPNPTVSLTPTYIPGVKFADTSLAAAGSTCAAPLTYAWTGPSSFSSTNPHILVTPVTSANYGTYTLLVRDANGCTASASQTINSSPLQVALTNFDAAANRCTAILSWKTASETSIKRFDVQSSADGNQFTTIGQIISKKNPEGSSYSFSSTQQNERGYYRLAIVDLDDNYAVSPTLEVTTKCDKSVITVAPNPTSGTVRVMGINAGDQVKVTNMVGQVVRTLASGGNTATFDLSSYPAGVYTVLVIQDQVVIKAAEVVKQ